MALIALGVAAVVALGVGGIVGAVERGGRKKLAAELGLSYRPRPTAELQADHTGAPFSRTGSVSGVPRWLVAGVLEGTVGDRQVRIFDNVTTDGTGVRVKPTRSTVLGIKAPEPAEEAIAAASGDHAGPSDNPR